MILIAGGTGLVGRHLIDLLLLRGHRIVVLTRNSKKQSLHDKRLCYVDWNPHQREVGQINFSEVKTIINLSGENVAQGRWTKKRKQEILLGRTESTGFLSQLANDNMPHLESFIQASAIGFYGEERGEIFKEDFPHADNFLGNTCHLWEKSLCLSKVRCVTLRIGLVFSPKGGFWASLTPILRWRMNPIFGNGNQYWSWIHIADLCQLIVYAMDNNHLSGTYNAVANFNRQKEITLAFFTIRKRMYFPLWIPSFLLQLIVGEMSIELLKSARVSNQKIKQLGFQFTYSHLNSLLQ